MKIDQSEAASRKMPLMRKGNQLRSGLGLWTDDCIVATSVDFSLSKSFETDTLTLDFTGPDSSPVLVSFAKISANLLSIPGYNWPITKVRVHGVILDNGVILARIEPPWALTTINDGLLSVAVPPTDLAVLPEARAQFVAFVSALMTQASHSYISKGTTDIAFQLPGFLSTKVINGISFATPVTFAGCNGLRDIHFLSVISVDSAPTAMTVTMSSIVLNPGQVQFILGDIVLQMFSKEGIEVGLVVFQNMSLAHGENKIRVVATFTAENSRTIDARLRVEDDVLTLAGFKGSSKNSILAEVWCTFKTQVTIPAKLFSK
ncbi:hypothetical protein BGZ75_004917 [Mortierella antarctica]|nr:hypothetical protein BGZ75_004917 [Mortierella antarctica]